MSDTEKRIRELADKINNVMDNVSDFNEEELKELYDQFINVTGILNDLEEVLLEEHMVINQDFLTKSANDIIEKVKKDE